MVVSFHMSQMGQHMIPKQLHRNWLLSNCGELVKFKAKQYLLLVEHCSLDHPVALFVAINGIVFVLPNRIGLVFFN